MVLYGFLSISVLQWSMVLYGVLSISVAHSGQWCCTWVCSHFCANLAGRCCCMGFCLFLCYSGRWCCMGFCLFRVATVRQAGVVWGFVYFCSYSGPVVLYVVLSISVLQRSVNKLYVVGVTFLCYSGQWCRAPVEYEVRMESGLLLVAAVAGSFMASQSILLKEQQPVAHTVNVSLLSR